jgi:hypothetical protein
MNAFKLKLISEKTTFICVQLIKKAKPDSFTNSEQEQQQQQQQKSL